eukprot:GGOE01002334.1.p1 GENE.GGOE01002334.1~~GGOE01002334.1.p1  ORF type:complete len:217 (+),score=6.34 GGOE01002334.1:52-702(+)
MKRKKSTSSKDADAQLYEQKKPKCGTCGISCLCTCNIQGGNLNSCHPSNEKQARLNEEECTRECKDAQVSVAGRPLRAARKPVGAYALLAGETGASADNEPPTTKVPLRRVRGRPPANRNESLLEIPIDQAWVMPKMDKWDQLFWDMRQKLLKAQLLLQSKQIERLKMQCQLLRVRQPNGSLQQGLPSMPPMYHQPTPIPRPPLDLSALLRAECKQ